MQFQQFKIIFKVYLADCEQVEDLGVQRSFKTRQKLKIIFMRKRGQREYEFGTVAIQEVDLSEKSRHQLLPLLKGLQYIYVNDDLRNAVLDIIEQKVKPIKKQEKKNKNIGGRPGMSLWEILVFAVLRLNLNLDYDALQDYGNHHKKVRGILGVLNVSGFDPELVYKLQTLKDNVGLLDEDCIVKINELLVKQGHEILKKKRRKKIN